MLKKLILATALVFLGSSSASAIPVAVVSGGTDILLDTIQLSNLGLDVSSVNPDIAGTVIPGSQTALINPATTTFGYDTDDLLNTITGVIGHTISVGFNADSLFLGDFTIEFFAGRAVGGNSGFFVVDNVSGLGPIFDIPTAGLALGGDAALFSISGDLVVSAELAALLGNAGVAGTDIGNFATVAEVRPTQAPEPATAALLAGALGLAWLRRRQS